MACSAAFFANNATASTAAFAGKVVEVSDVPRNQKDSLRQFTVEIYYFDYISWNKFGSHSKVGETITRRIKSQGTVCVLNGRLTNSATLAAAIRAGQWGYFYEDTWLDLFTLPDFVWGEVISHHPARQQFELRIHLTHKKVHIDTNPPRTITVRYDGQTTFRVEERDSTPADALTVGSWVQVHEPRPQFVLVRTKASTFKPAELLPHGEGRRGFANDLSAPATLRGYQTKQPAGVIDIPVQLHVTRQLGGKSEDTVLNCRSTTFILDGKPCPVEIAVRPGRHAVLCHYRRETTPHKVFVESMHDGLRGKIHGKPKDGGSVVVLADGQRRIVELAGDAEYRKDGQRTTAAEAIKQGFGVVIYPQRGRTVIAFPKDAPAE
jgi:hypothetical protein